MDLKEVSILGDAIDTHWYYLAKGRAMRAMLGDHRAAAVLDVGAGSGVFSRQLLDAGVVDEATCVDIGYTSERDEIHNGKPLRFKRAADRSTYGVILLMDVLEHVDDDVGLLQQYAARAGAHARVLISVPAFSWLWSGHDVVLEHRRRYTRRQLVSVVERSGLRVLGARYFFAPLLPLVAATRLWDRLQMALGRKPESLLRPAPEWLNRLLLGVHLIELRTVFPYNRLAGLSVLCVCTPERVG